MPQMMPLSWLSLYIFFSLMLLMFAFMNYYSHIPKPNSSEKKNINIKMMNWKW
uniref:ATP synthase F0 subunit 8 n=1 Tax=Pseudothyrsocera sinensis TaxID=1928798 RepID=UPI0027A22FCE|nr:ATP synthase F0 subunit 8 [Pseudothyrsocera sinensis]WGO57239.1 ATP synthase F0 subunit 8 [Pseudothyrsocera sinensis]